MNSQDTNIDIGRNMKYALDVRFHLIFWVIMQIYYFYVMDFFGIPFERSLHSKLFFLPFQLIAAYFMLFVLLGRYLYKGKYVKAIVGFVIFIFVFSYMVSAFNHFVVNPYFDSEYVQPELSAFFLDVESLITDYMRVIFLTPMILICLEFGVSQYQKMKEVEDLLVQKNQAELNLLKTQIHPNFLLSTLRNLEKLTERNDVDGPIVIERLSETLDYILYQGRKEKIDLKKEIEAISDYIALENIRFKNVMTIDLILGDLKETKPISPLLLFSFLEFNLMNFNQKNIPFSECEISIKEVENWLQCSIKNTIKNSMTKPYLDYEIGKMKRQLDISYPNSYKLDIQKSQKINQITLELKL